MKKVILILIVAISLFSCSTSTCTTDSKLVSDLSGTKTFLQDQYNNSNNEAEKASLLVEISDVQKQIDTEIHKCDNF
jgi:hypothetical protein